MITASNRGKEKPYKAKVPQHNTGELTRFRRPEKTAEAEVQNLQQTKTLQRINPRLIASRVQALKQAKSPMALLVRAMAIVLVASSLTGMAGCTILARKPVTVVEPQLLRTTDVEGTLQTTDFPADSVSPDGSHFLAVKDDADGSHLVIMPVDGEYSETICIESVSKDWLSGSWFSYRPLGWTSDSEFMYTKVGWQPSGAHKSERGVALVIGRLSGLPGKSQSETKPGTDGQAGQTSTEEAAFFALPYRDSSLQTLFLPGQKQVYLNNNTTIWQFDIAEKSLTVLKSDLPDYIYRRPIPSPKGDYFVYELNEKDKSGIFIFNTATGEEKPLLPNGDTMSFYPAWSFDGKYIAAYTVGKKEGASRTAWHNYMLFEGEDTAQSIGSSITVVDREGTVVDTIQVEGKYLQNFRWSQNDHTIGFLAGSAQPSQGENSGLPSSVLGEGVWMARIGKSSKQAEAPVYLGDIPRDANGTLPYSSLITFGPDSKGIFCNVYENGAWFFAENGKPVKVVDGLWPGFDGETAPVYGNSVVALVSVEESGKEFWILNADQATKFGEVKGPWAWVVANSDSKLIIFCGDVSVTSDNATDYPMAFPRKGKLAVYSMLKSEGN